MGVVVFIAVAVTIAVLIHLYLWQRLVRDTTLRPQRGSATPRHPLSRPGWWRRAGGLAVLAAAVLLVVTLFLEPRWLAAAGYVWLGVMFYLLVALLVLELPVLAARLVQRRARTRATAKARGVDEAREVDEAEAGREARDVDEGRRLLLRRTAAIAAGVVAVGVSGYGVSRAYRAPTVRRLEVPLARLDPRSDGLRVAVVADIHVGPMYGRGQVERIVDLVNGLDADLVTVVGDLISSEGGAARESAAPLRRLRSRYGSFFVTGNHEYYHGYEEWIEAAEELGLRVLRNERVEVVHGGGAIDLAGVNDREGSNYGDPPDYAAALGDRDPSRPVLLLAHQPVQVHRAAQYGVDLQLSGHTHGGQVWPFDFLVRLDQPVVSGLAQVDGTLVYVTNGAGFWGPPMRVGADPDITLLEVRSG